MSTKRFKQILPSAKYALSTEEELYSSVLLDGDMRIIPEVETGENILVEEVFEDERDEGTIYRISAQLDMLVLIDDPYIKWDGTIASGTQLGTLPNPKDGCDGTSNPNNAIYGGSNNYGASAIYPQLKTLNSENNWFVKVLYPESSLPNNTRISFSHLYDHTTVSPWDGITIYTQDGLPIVGMAFVEIKDILYPCIITETDVQLEPDDYVYINEKYIHHPNSNAGQPFALENFVGFRRVLYTNINVKDLGIELGGFKPADNKCFIIDSPIVNASKVQNSTFFQQLSNAYQNLYNDLDSYVFQGSYKRVIGVSKSDIDDDTISASTAVWQGGVLSVDEDGTPNPTGQYTKITTTSPHGLSTGFYVVGMRSKGWPYGNPGGPTNEYMTGIWRVSSVPVDQSTGEPIDTEFILDVNANPFNLSSGKRLLYRAVDAIASDYKVRMFKELTTVDDYILDRTAFATNIYADGTFLINTIKDVNTRDLTDYLGRPLSELYLGFIKRAGELPYDWSRVVSHFSHIVQGIEGHLITPDNTKGDPGYFPIPGVQPLTSYGTHNPQLESYGKTTFPLEYTYGRTTTNFTNGISDYPSDRIPTNTTLNAWKYGTDKTSDSKYIGDLIEYNRGELTERVISPINHRFNTTWRAFGYANKHAPTSSTPNICWAFSSSYEGLFYQPFHRYPIKKWADAVEAATPPAAQPDDPFSAYTESIQFEGVPTYAEEIQGLKIWRDLLDPGVMDSEGGIDNPFLNGAHYLYDNIKISLRRQTPGRSGFSKYNAIGTYNDQNTIYTPNDQC